MLKEADNYLDIRIKVSNQERRRVEELLTKVDEYTLRQIIINLLYTPNSVVNTRLCIEYQPNNVTM